MLWWSPQKQKEGGLKDIKVFQVAWKKMAKGKAAVLAYKSKQ